jgi:hypothetical protein
MLSEALGHLPGPPAGPATRSDVLVGGVGIGPHFGGVSNPVAEVERG